MRNLIIIIAVVGSFSFGFGQKTIVEKYGQLSIKGSHIFGEKGDTVQLRGMSFFWSQWDGKYYTPQTVKWLKDDWKCTVLRTAMGTEKGMYASDPDSEKKKVITVVDAAIQQGMYVVIDYHSNQAHKKSSDAIKFFAEMAQKYGKYPNVIYEIYNEPEKDLPWTDSIKPYAVSVINAIRQYDPDNIIIVPTPDWCQKVEEAAMDPIKGSNLAYSLHFSPGNAQGSFKICCQTGFE